MGFFSEGLWLFLGSIHFHLAFVAVRAESTAGVLQRGAPVAEHVLRELGKFRFAVSCTRDENVEYLVIRVITGWSGSTVCIPRQHNLGYTVCEKGKARGKRKQIFCSLFFFLQSKLSSSPLATELLCSSRSDIA